MVRSRRHANSAPPPSSNEITPGSGTVYTMVRMGASAPANEFWPKLKRFFAALLSTSNFASSWSAVPSSTAVCTSSTKAVVLAKTIVDPAVKVAGSPVALERSVLKSPPAVVQFVELLALSHVVWDGLSVVVTCSRSTVLDVLVDASPCVPVRVKVTEVMTAPVGIDDGIAAHAILKYQSCRRGGDRPPDQSQRRQSYR